jgi:hypothetical protein
MDPNFDLSPKDAQQSLLDICSDLTTLDLVSLGQVQCWTTGFNAWLKTKYNLQMPVNDP